MVLQDASDRQRASIRERELRGRAALRIRHLEDRAHQLGELARLGHVDLVERDEAGTVGEVALGAAVLLELVLDRCAVSFEMRRSLGERVVLAEVVESA